MPLPTVAEIPSRPPGRPPADLGTRAEAVADLLARRLPVEKVMRANRIGRATLYRWVREVCASDHPHAEALRRLAEARGLLVPDA